MNVNHLWIANIVLLVCDVTDSFRYFQNLHNDCSDTLKMCTRDAGPEQSLVLFLLFGFPIMSKIVICIMSHLSSASIYQFACDYFVKNTNNIALPL